MGAKSGCGEDFAAEHHARWFWAFSNGAFTAAAAQP